MSFDEDTEAFNRAFGLPAEGEPLVSEDQKKEMLIDDESAFQRAVEADAVDVDNSDVETEGDSLWNRFFSEPYERGIQRQAETFGRIGSTIEAGSMEGIQAALNDPAVLQEQYRTGTNVPSVLLQTVTTPLRVAFDSASEMILFGAEKAIGWLPEGLKEGAKEQFAALMETEGGQMAMAAAGEGVEAWKEFEQNFPNEAANLVAIMDLGFTRGTGTLVKQPVVPMKIEKVGMRNEAKPLAGGDADVYNILFGGKKKTKEQVELTDDPAGIRGVQEQIATPEQVAMIDVAKSAGVSGSNTVQKNFNNLQRHYDELETKLMAMLKKHEKKISPPEVRDNMYANVKAQFDAMIQSNPKLMANKEARGQVSKLYQEFVSILDEQGATLQGLRVARSMFDDRVRRMGMDVAGDRLTTSNLAAMAVRKGVNTTIYQVAPEAEDLFSRMSNLIPVLNSVNEKAATEGATAFGRFVAQLGLEGFSGSSAQSKVINAGYVLAALPVVVPYNILKKRVWQAPGPAKVRAKVAYVKRDVFSEIDKAIKATKDPVKKSMLIRDSKEVYSYLNAVFKQIESEVSQEEPNQ